MKCRCCHQELPTTTLWGFPVVIKTDGDDIPVPFVKPQAPDYGLNPTIDVDRLHDLIQQAYLECRI